MEILQLTESLFLWDCSEGEWPLKFTKMHGLGNDFVLIHCDEVPNDASKLAITLCNRHTGIGADGLVFIFPSIEADIRMCIFNSDGVEAEQCGNAVRCVAKYAHERLRFDKTEMHIETRRGIQTVWMQENGNVRVDMGPPILDAKQIPVKINKPEVVKYPVETENEVLHVTCVSMGNPHAIIEVSDIKKVPLEVWGPQIETHTIFPNKTNVEFISIGSPQKIIMRVWERGVGRTQACGSGACAAVVAGILWGKLDRKVTVHLEGGDLDIEWHLENEHVYMTGPATFVFEGNVI